MTDQEVGFRKSEYHQHSGPTSDGASSKYSTRQRKSPCMTNWRAVLIGFVVEIVLGVVGLLLPGIGQLAAGLIGGFVAGYIAKAGLGGGAWHGLLAGSIGGIILAIFLTIAVTIIGTIGLGPFGPLLGSFTFLAAIMVAILFAIDSAIGGAIGGLLAGE